jgi:hypothetical protein
MQPLTTHPAFAELYKKDFFIEAEHLKNILQQGKSSVPELEKMIDQAIDHFKKIEKESWHENFFFIHALYLLDELDAQESLPHMLKVAAQNHAFLEYWFSDTTDQEVPRLIARLGRNQPEVCMDFLQDKKLYVQSRYLAINALGLIALINPEKRAQIMDFFREHLSFLIENKETLGEIYPNDDNLSWFTVYDYVSYILVDFQEKNFTELEEEIRACYRNGLMDEQIAGGEADIVFEIRETPVLQNIYEKYEELKEWAGEFSPFHPNAKELEAKRQKEAEKARQELARWQREQALAELEAMPVRTGPKIGRNDPCPCGSGKKYKKCCME